MGGGLLQLVAYGAQDIYLTGNPQITFFKVIYRRHTNFSMECVKQTITGVSTVSTTGTSKGSVIISRNGDLLHQLWVRTNSTVSVISGSDTIDAGINGDCLIDDAILEIGGQRIDRHTKEWNQVWAELTTPESKSAGYKYLTGGFNNTLDSASTTNTNGTLSNKGSNQQSIMIPFNFWFCRDIGLSLPLIALQYHDVELKFTLGSGAAASGISRGGTHAVAPEIEIWADYIYLDTDERRRFAQVSHEYLIEQVQIQGEGDSLTEYKLNFEHPVKELIWTSPTSSTTASTISTQKLRLEINGHDRFTEQTREYFQIKQPMVHHTSVPGYNIKEVERPIYLSQPKNILGDVTAVGSVEPHSTSGSLSDGKFCITKGTASLPALLSFESTTDPELKIGDILAINYEITADASSHTVFCEIVSIKQHWRESGDQADYYISNNSTSINKIHNSVAGDGSIYKIAGHQQPQSRCSQLSRDINVFSFAIHPEDHQPSGTCNFSKIDHAKLILSAAGTITNIYAVNYNVLRIMSGMGGLAYSS